MGGQNPDEIGRVGAVLGRSTRHGIDLSAQKLMTHVGVFLEAKVFLERVPSMAGGSGHGVLVTIVPAGPHGIRGRRIGTLDRLSGKRRALTEVSGLGDGSGPSGLCVERK
jgi:hypothetical protein